MLLRLGCVKLTVGPCSKPHSSRLGTWDDSMCNELDDTSIFERDGRENRRSRPRPEGTDWRGSLKCDNQCQCGEDQLKSGKMAGKL